MMFNSIDAAFRLGQQRYSASFATTTKNELLNELLRRTPKASAMLAYMHVATLAINMTLSLVLSLGNRSPVAMNHLRRSCVLTFRFDNCKELCFFVLRLRSIS